MKIKRRGFSCHPGKYGSLLDMGIAGKHGFSHWRTFSNRCLRPDKLFKDGLKCAVDKYMGYRLEENGIGMFVDKICYKYRQRLSYSISTSEPTRKVWKQIIKEASNRRKNNNIKIFPIIL